MFADIWTNVVGKMHEHCSATVSGFQRRAVKGVSFPCMIEATPTDVVEGVVYFGLTDREMKILDEFEAQQYQRQTVGCRMNGEVVDAEVYLWRDEYRELIDGDWDPDWFQRKGISQFRR